jgi:thiol-disulfide isomerase/thioredoxin
VLPQPADNYRKTVSFTALKGKTVVLNFWFTACGSCILEISELNKLQQQYAGKNVVFLIRFVQVGGQDIATKLAPAIDATN